MANDLDALTKCRLALNYGGYHLRELYQWYRSTPVTVDTRSGPVRGVQVQSEFGQAYAQFTGIPYARPPIGELRFCDPVPVEPWTDVFMATKESKACQRDFFVARFCGQEDCLHLNIYTKQLDNDAVRSKSTTTTSAGALVPVLVFFHGGAFMFGCNNKELYNPEFLLRQDVILVTVNYRLGAFGFLSVDDPTAKVPGNAGLKDQVLALRWIRDNIAAFGGDPQSVTIFGESAGGCSVHYHLLSPMSKGLFHRAIAMSGSVMTSWAVCPLQQLPERLARAVGWDGTGGTVEMMRVLRSANTDRLMKAQERLADSVEKRQYMMFTFGPKVEPYVADQCFMNEDPVLMNRAPWSRDIPVIFSVCSNEGLLVHKATLRSNRLIENLQERFQDMVPLDLMGGVHGDRDSDVTKAIAAEFRRFYFGDARMDLSQLTRFEEMMSDKLFLHGSYRALRMRLEAAKAQANGHAEPGALTWYLRFDVESKQMNLTKYMFASKNERGACHADDCHFLFKTCIHPHLARDSPDFVSMDRFVNLVTEFARTGNPNSEQLRQLVQWDPVQLDKPVHCLNLAYELTFVEMPELERMRFWDTLYEKYQTREPADRPENESATIPVASL